jgi:hypothetical protein
LQGSWRIIPIYLFLTIILNPSYNSSSPKLFNYCSIPFFDFTKPDIITKLCTKVEPLAKAQILVLETCRLLALQLALAIGYRTFDRNSRDNALKNQIVVGVFNDQSESLST